MTKEKPDTLTRHANERGLFDLVSRLNHEIFSFTPHDANGKQIGDEIHIDATAARYAVVRNPMIAEFTVFDVDKRLYEHVRDNNGVTREKMERLALRPDIFSQPMLIAEYEDGSHIFFDGNTRFLLLYEMGIRKMQSWLFKPDQWRKFEIQIPSDLKDFLS